MGECCLAVVSAMTVRKIKDDKLYNLQLCGLLLDPRYFPLHAGTFHPVKSGLTAPSGLCGHVQTVVDPHSPVHFVAPARPSEILAHGAQ